MRDIENVLIRLYEKLEIKKDIQFGEKYNIKGNTISSWKKRNSIPYELISNIAYDEKISMDYIINGIEYKDLNEFNNLDNKKIIELIKLGLQKENEIENNLDGFSNLDDAVGKIIPVIKELEEKVRRLEEKVTE